LVVPAPRDQPHVPKKVYTDCRHRINNKKDVERHRSPIRINTNLRDSRLNTLGDKSPIRKVQGLNTEVESDDEYVPSKDIESNYHDRTRSQVPDWGKLRPGPFTERIKNARQDREVWPLRIPFYTGTDRLYSADDLYTIRQKEDEPLREYAARFSHEYLRCPESDDRAAYGAFKSGLRSSHFRYLVHKSSAGNKRKDNRDNRQGNSKKGRGKYDRTDHRAPLPNHDRAQEVFTLLNTTYEAVLMNEHEQIPKPTNRKPNRQDNRDTGKFCRYHQQNSHNTEDCISLRKIVERLIREGKLDLYIAKPQQAPAPNANRQINMISTISGGPTLAGPSNRSVKQYVRTAHYPQVFGIEADRHRKFAKVGWEPITFSEEDEEGIIYPHDDPMIIRADIADYDVGRVLIDTGSSVNVIFADAFKGLGVADGMVNRQITPLLSFSGDLVQPVGSVSLPIAFGVAPRKTMTYDQFLIVDCPTAYNVIIWRTALTRIKAHLSPHMLLMKFPTCNGTGAVRGDQLSARTCYATALKSVATKPPVEAMSVRGLPNGSGPIDDPREETPTPLAQPAEELETVVLNEEHPDRCLSISPTCKLVRQKRRSYDTERSVLIRKPEKAELPIFYVSKALQSAELRYPPLEQLALALVTSARRLRPYFQAHQITVMTNQPLRQPRPAEKGQIVADFISELTLPAPSEQLITELTPPVTESVSAERFDPSVPVWILHVDGSANQ
ncbi:unnamed protein product, partial [Prunus brigantina]